MKPETRVRRASLPITDVTIDDQFWAPRQRTVRARTLAHQEHHLRTGGQFEALRLQWRPGRLHQPHPFWESDVAKWIEAASYTLATHPNPTLAAAVDEAIGLLAGAQQPDGYLNVYFTVVKPGQRFTDLRDAHELYGLGHLIEAGVAHHQATGKTTLLEIVRRYADLIDRETGPGGRIEGGYDGHEEIELALVRLYRETGERRYLELSARLVDSRGTEPYYFDLERDRRGDEGWAGGPLCDRPRHPEKYRRYGQAHLPVREQHEVVGHAVRAMYLYSAMADLALELEDKELRETCERLWDDLVSRKLYITGGIGADASIEGFGAAYDLPDADAYSETCASIGLVFWAHRMMLLTGEGRYIDVLERALYNGVLSGMSLDGTRYFYGNPLASDGTLERSEWFGTACCPPNLARLLSSLEQYVYVQDDHGLSVNLYTSGSARFRHDGGEIIVRQATRYPWNGRVTLQVDPQAGDTHLTLRLHIPEWAGAPAEVTVNGEPVVAPVRQGYAVLDRIWHARDEVELILPMTATRTWAHPAVRAAAGKVAIQRGPIVHCVEEVDNDAAVPALAIERDGELRVVQLEGMDVDQVLAEGIVQRTQTEGLYTTRAPSATPTQLRTIPYFAWSNRGRTTMAVWLPEAGQ